MVEILSLFKICESNIQEVHEFFGEPACPDPDGCFVLFKYLSTFARDYSTLVGFKLGSIDPLEAPRRSSIFTPKDKLLRESMFLR